MCECIEGVYLIRQHLNVKYLIYFITNYIHIIVYYNIIDYK